MPKLRCTLRRCLLAAGAMFCLGFVQAQQKGEMGNVVLDFYTAPREVGMDCLSGKPLPAQEYNFGGYIQKSVYDSLHHTVTLQLRSLTKNEKYFKGKGVLLAMDLNTAEVLWSRWIDFPAGSAAITLWDGFLLHADGVKTVCFDPLTGESLWESRYLFKYVNPDSTERIALGYPWLGPGSYSQNLKGVDLNTGKSLWSRKIPDVNGWEELERLDEDNLLVRAAGLHKINLKTGEGWSYEAPIAMALPAKQVTDDEIKAADEQIRKGWITGGYGTMRGLSSSPLVTEDLIYFCDKDKVVGLTQAGIPAWDQPFPEGTGASSDLLHDDSLLYVIGRGLASFWGKTVAHGRPFLAAYDKSDGTPRFFEVIDQRKCRIQVTGFHFDSVVLVTQDQIQLRSLEDGRGHRAVDIDTALYGEIISRLDGEQFYRRDTLTGRFRPVARRFDDWSLYTTKKKLLQMDEQFGIEAVFDTDSLFYCYQKRDNLTVLRRDSLTCLVDDNGTPRATLTSRVRPMWYGKYFYVPARKGIIQIDLQEVYARRYEQPAPGRETKGLPAGEPVVLAPDPRKTELYPFEN